MSPSSLIKNKSVVFIALIVLTVSFSTLAFAYDVFTPQRTNENGSSKPFPTQDKTLPPTFPGPLDPKWTNENCDQNSFKAAFITFDNSYISHHSQFILKDPDFPNDNELSVIKKAQMNLPTYFNYATEGLAQVDTSYPLVIMPLKPEYIAINQGIIPYEIRTNVAAKDFYAQHPDEFDFLFFIPSAEFNSGFSQRVSNLTLGLGLPNEMIGYNFYNGSEGKLKQVITLAINLFIPNNLDYSDEQFMLHEMGHQWCCYFGDELSQAYDLNLNLDSPHLNNMIQKKDLEHFNVMQSYGRWKPQNNPNWFHRLAISEGLDKMTDYSTFHPFTLYMMGVLPEDRYEEEFAYFDDQDPNFPFSNQLRAGNLNVNDLIDILGPRECVVSNSGPTYDN